MSQMDRIYGFDTLRAFALLLGILLHAIMPYLEPPINIWIVLDDDKHIGYTILLIVIHAFRLQTFFLLAGFFASLLIAKRGLSAFIRNRFQRIFIPFVLSVLFLVPLLQCLMIVGYSLREGAGYVEIGALIIDTQAYNTTVVEFFRSGRFLEEFFLYHIWFLYYLLMVYVIFVVIRGLALRFQISEMPNHMGRWLLESRWGVLILAIASAITMWPMRMWVADTPDSLIPDGSILVYYFLLFLMGVALHQNSDLLEVVKKRSWTMLTLAILLLPIFVFFQTLGPNPYGKPVVWAYKPIALLSYALFTWVTVLGLVGGFAKWFTTPQKRIRLISETAYWQYLVHLPILAAMQIGLHFVDWPSAIEILLQVVIAFLIMYYAYVLLVGRTIVGNILCGRRIQEVSDF